MSDVVVAVTITRVRQIGNPDGFGGGSADYYAKVRIDGVTRKSGHRHDVPDWRPNWEFRHGAAPRGVVPIRIELWDHDTTSADDMADINPRSGKKGLDLTYDVAAGTIGGDVAGTRGVEIEAVGAGDSDRARLSFVIDHSTPSVPARLPEVLASDVRIKALWNATAAGTDLSMVEGRLRDFNNRLYDCTDGQWRVGRFLIHDNRSELSDTGSGVGHIHRTAMHGAHGHAGGRPDDPEHWEVNENSGAGTYLMEFLHSWTGLKDEYEESEDGPSTSCPASSDLRTATNACVMDRTSTTRELCRPETHNPKTEQGNVRKMDCYSWLRRVMREAGHDAFVVPAGHIAGPRTAPRLRFVYLTIQRVRQIGNPDSVGGGTADYYSKVQMDGKWFKKSRHRHDRAEVTPNWIYGLAFSSDSHRTIPIRIELWDHDTTSADDRCDINPRSGKKRLDLLYNTATGAIGGDASGARDASITVTGSGDSDRAALTFVVTSR